MLENVTVECISMFHILNKKVSSEVNQYHAGEVEWKSAKKDSGKRHCKTAMKCGLHIQKNPCKIIHTNSQQIS